MATWVCLVLGDSPSDPDPNNASKPRPSRRFSINLLTPADSKRKLIVPKGGILAATDSPRQWCFWVQSIPRATCVLRGKLFHVEHLATGLFLRTGLKVVFRRSYGRNR